MSNAADLAEELMERTPIVTEPRVGVHTCVAITDTMEKPIVFTADDAEKRTGHLALEGFDLFHGCWAGGYVDRHGRIQWLGNAPNLRSRIRPKLEELQREAR